MFNILEDSKSINNNTSKPRLRFFQTEIEVKWNLASKSVSLTMGQICMHVCCKIQT